MELTDEQRKERKIRLMCLLVICMLVPAVLVYYEWQIAAANNLQQMQEHATTTINKNIHPSNLTLTQGNTNSP